MPKIAAPTVAEHRANIQNKLVDAAEEILRAGEPDRLTAATVASAAGIARNSIYRYVESVDDLRGMVLSRYMPTWLQNVADAIAEIDDPAERLVVWMATNLRESARSGHGWMMVMGRGDMSEATEKVMEMAHAQMRSVLSRSWGELLEDPARARVASGLTGGIMEASFRQLDAGGDVDIIVEVASRAVRGLVAGVVADTVAVG